MQLWIDIAISTDMETLLRHIAVGKVTGKICSIILFIQNIKKPKTQQNPQSLENCLDAYKPKSS